MKKWKSHALFQVVILLVLKNLIQFTIPKDVRKCNTFLICRLSLKFAQGAKRPVNTKNYICISINWIFWIWNQSNYTGPRGDILFGPNWFYLNQKIIKYILIYTNPCLAGNIKFRAGRNFENKNINFLN